MFSPKGRLQIKLASIGKWIWNAIFNPKVRLNADYPLSGKKLGKAYLISEVYFLVGSFIPAAATLLFVLATIVLTKVESHLPRAVTQVLFPVFLYLGNLLTNSNQSTVMVVFAALSFVTGFGAELWYLRKFLAKDGKSLKDIISLDLDSLKGASRKATLWALSWRTAFAMLLWTVMEAFLGKVLPAPHQATMDLTKNLVDSSLVIYFLLAAVAAPILEEVVFRGFLFRGLRATFREGRIGRWLKTPGRADFCAVVVSALIFSAAHAFTGSNAVAFFMIFLMGCYMAEVYRRTGTLWVGILFHAINNGYVVLLLALHR